jgi:hypothetical protein
MHFKQNGNNFNEGILCMFKRHKFKIVSTNMYNLSKKIYEDLITYIKVSEYIVN